MYPVSDNYLFCMFTVHPFFFWLFWNNTMNESTNTVILIEILTLIYSNWIRTFISHFESISYLMPNSKWRCNNESLLTAKWSLLAACVATQQAHCQVAWYRLTNPPLRHRPKNLLPTVSSSQLQLPTVYRHIIPSQFSMNITIFPWALLATST